MDKTQKSIETRAYFLKNFIELTRKESEEVLRWRNNEKIRIHMYDDTIIPLDNHLKFIEGLKNDTKNAYWIVQSKKEGEKIGVISLNRINPVHKNSYLGIYGNPESSYPGRGLVLMECLDYLASEVFGLHTLKLEVLETNQMAKKLYLKCGYAEEGLLKEFVYKNGEWINVTVMGKIFK